MTALEGFLGAVRGRLSRRRALIWGARGAALAAFGGLAAQLAVRRWPGLSATTLTVACAAGLLVAVVGWARGRPSLEEVARLADVRLGASERLSTAWELAGSDGYPVGRQRTDAEEWVGRADPAGVVTSGWPRKVMAVAVGAAALSLVLGALENPAVARMEADQAAKQAREEVAKEVEDLAEQAELGSAPTDPEGKALVRELRKAAEGLRDHPGSRGAGSGGAGPRARPARRVESTSSWPRW